MLGSALRDALRQGRVACVRLVAHLAAHLPVPPLAPVRDPLKNARRLARWLP